jgi:hypothetical protein
VYLLGYIWGCPNAPKQHEKNYFLVVLDHFSYKNGPIDLVRGFFSSLDIGPYIPRTCGLFVPFWVQMGVPKCPKTALKNYFLVGLVKVKFWTISLTIMGLLIWLGAYFQARTLGHTAQLLWGLCVPFWVHLGVPKCPKTT